MKTLRIPLGSVLGSVLWASLAAVHVPASAEGATVYRCPGPPVLYTDAISAQEAQKRGCRTIEGAPITVMKTVKPAPVQSSGPHDSKVDQNEQRARDADARRILEAELKREQDNLAGLKQEYNNGQPERRGDERNFAKYQERVDSLKNAIARKEADIEALKREIAKHGS
jgi:predicted RNase H-like nuclease (RuvC/YqgF family)